MKSISILVPESSVMQAICDPQYLFSAVNNFLMTAGKPALFDVKLVGATREVKLTEGHFSVHADLLLEEVEQTDLVFIPALFGDMSAALAKNKALVPWIIKQHDQGAELASLCVGAFLLADTGLLDGKKCSTHWLHGNEFRRMFPQVELVDGRIVTEEDRIYSSGGANSYWNLLLHLVEKYTDRATAILAAKFFAIDIGRSSQSAFAIFQGQKAHGDEEIKQVQQHIEDNFTEKFTIDELADMVALGRRSFERRFKAATNNTVLEYIQRVKIEVAKRSLESGRKNVNEVMFDVGYGDAKAFRDVFKKVTGLTPIDYRNIYRNQQAA
ncbi:MAG: helix-turn-helix domain-containing protein [Bacteroidetes bacterium]|nr:helix-turn-helix domain-containing protein [Bacteroidota bacterium]